MLVCSPSSGCFRIFFSQIVQVWFFHRFKFLIKGLGFCCYVQGTLWKEAFPVGTEVRIAFQSTIANNSIYLVGSCGHSVSMLICLGFSIMSFIVYDS
jgi:hypothetical protein